MILRAREFQFTFPRPAIVMGIVNVTPDSFSDGGHYLEPERAIERALQLEREGAEILDIGGESTRPKSAPVSLEEELRRVVPVLRGLAGRVRVPISIDTMKPEVAKVALDLGASILNDVGANREDDAMWRLAAVSGSAYVCMHMRGTPQTMQAAPDYVDVVGEVESFFLGRLRRLIDCGVLADQIIIDPGIGFGKTLKHNLRLLAHTNRFAALGRPVLIGVSRKSFIEKLLHEQAGDRLAGSLACACWTRERGAGLFRVHDVAETVRALRMTEALEARRSG